MSSCVSDSTYTFCLWCWNSRLTIGRTSEPKLPPYSLLPTLYSLLPTVISWYGEDDAGQKLPSGVYFLQLKTENQSAIKKVLYLK